MKKLNLKTIITLGLIIIVQLHVAAQCTSSCTTDLASSGETSCVSLGVPTYEIEAGIDAVNNSNDPFVIAALGGNTLVNKLDNCCGPDDACVSIEFTIPTSGGSFSLHEINSLGSGSVYIDCQDFSTAFDQLLAYSPGDYELIFCPPGGSGSKRIGFAPLFEVTTTVSNETISGANDGSISVSYDLGNPNVAPSGTVSYSLDEVGGTTANTDGTFTDLAPGTYSTYVYDSADPSQYNVTEVVVAAAPSCDINDGSADCDADGVINSLDCDPLDPAVGGEGSACTDSNGDAGTYDTNCLCIASTGDTSGGTDGGLESNSRLADKIARRNFLNETRHKETYKQLSDGLIPFPKEGGLYRNDEINIHSLVPQNLWNAYVSQSTPMHLTEVTNATDVISADYFIGHGRSAVLMILRSEGGVYEHAKYICDRLDGSSLNDIFYTDILGEQYITYHLSNGLGKEEFATSISFYIEDGSAHFENHWNLDSYTQQETYYNLQIWASSIEKLKSLTIAVIKNIEKQVTIGEHLVTEIPTVYLMQGAYANGKIELKFKNTASVTNVKLEGTMRLSETSPRESFTSDVVLYGDEIESYTVETSCFYDMGLRLKHDGGLDDEIFIADGAWGYNTLSSESNLIAFSSIPHNADCLDDDERNVERGISLVAEVKDKAEVFRSLTPKWKPENLTEYKYLNLNLQGKGMLEIALVNPTIDDWSEQMRYYIDLDALTSDQASIAFTQFEAYSSEKLSSVTMLVFSLVGDNVNYTPMQMDIDCVRFSNSVSTAVSDVIINNENTLVWPNPARDHINVSSDSRIEAIKIYNLQGGLIKEIQIRGVVSETDHLDLTELESGLYPIEIIKQNGEISVQKVLITK